MRRIVTKQLVTVIGVRLIILVRLLGRLAIISGLFIVIDVVAAIIGRGQRHLFLLVIFIGVRMGLFKIFILILCIIVIVRSRL